MCQLTRWEESFYNVYIYQITLLYTLDIKCRNLALVQCVHSIVLCYFYHVSGNKVGLFFPLIYFRSVLAILVPLLFHILFRIFIIINENFVGIFIGIALILYIKLGRMDIFTMVSLKCYVYSTSMSLYLFRSLIIFYSSQHTSSVHVLLDLNIPYFINCNGIYFSYQTIFEQLQVYMKIEQKTKRVSIYSLMLPWQFLLY